MCVLRHFSVCVCVFEELDIDSYTLRWKGEEDGIERREEGKLSSLCWLSNIEIACSFAWICAMGVYVS